MRRLSAAIRVLRACTRGTVSLVQYLRRRRVTDLTRPRVEVQLTRPPSWGADKFNVAIANVGPTRVVSCRYCRLQQFAMAAPDGLQPTFTSRRWYCSDIFSIPAGKTVKITAYLTRDRLCQDVLSDVVSPAEVEGLHAEALLCKDSTGTIYRFRFDAGASDLPDIYSPGLLDTYRHRKPPPWSQSIGNDAEVAAVKWR